MAALQAGDPQRVGPYVLLGRLGSGGMGRVYLARSPGGRMVAVKVIRANLAEDAGFRARFAREVSAARKVGGLFTAQVVDADTDGPVPWLVTAYVPGTSLSHAVERQGPLPENSVLALAAGLAEGLIAIHAAGVIHRDLKPSNVLLAQDGPRIIDFGISSAADATALTGTGFMIGSPGFMSPEQAEGLVVGPASDIFSLAGVLIYAARGEGPFGTGDTAALLYRVVHGKPNIDHVPDHIRPLIERSLSRDPRRRPTAAEFLADLSAPDGAVAGAMADPMPPVPDAMAPMALAAGALEAGTREADPVTSGNTTVDPPTRTTVSPQSYADPEPRGYRTGQDDPVAPGYRQDPVPPAYQGGPPPGPVTRTRPRWLLPAAGAAVIQVVVVVLVLALGSGDSPPRASNSQSPAVGPAGTHGASPGPGATPTTGNLSLAQLQVGDCLTGKNLDLNLNTPWPKQSQAVPCGQGHTAEVFLADSGFFAAGGSYPGDSTIKKDATAGCNGAFQSYIGLAYQKSVYTWTDVVPDASTWPSGDRALHCVVYYATSSHPAGVTLHGSLKGAAR